MFSIFELFVFIALEAVAEYRTTHLPGLYFLKKNREKMASFGPKPWVNPFGKISIFRLERRFFVL